MKFVIFADRSYNYIKPLANGLQKTLIEMGHSSEILYNGIYWLSDLNLFKVVIADIYRIYLNIKHKQKDLFIYRFFGLFFFLTAKRRKLLKECDCIIIVNNCPSAFLKNKRIDWLREKFNKPIVNYDFHYLPNQGWWKYMNEGYRGLEQYDWYLPVGLVTEFAIPKGIPKIYTCIGMDVNSKDLYPEQDDFIVLLDFPRPGHEIKRSEEKKTLEELGVKFIELHGRYTTKQIRAIYRKASVYLVSCRESFGLPIVELQLCGAKIFTPYLEWVPAHYLNKSINKKSAGLLGENFVVYENKDGLKKALQKAKIEFNASKNVEKFKEDYPFYNQISNKMLETFVLKLKEGAITSQSHEEYKKYNGFISKDDDYKQSDRI
ncbi:hypothetical protein [Fibrobacter succinogenes]|uniref:hypothetical protein n=1 Tax=Fibrobacter succinogenes TaxID=833 RepID=UPI00156800B7|nr:hypothetical protein [Fibrobacter succinogenes]